METIYADTLKKYLDDLAARKAAPGGGSAAALSAALGAALISMVVNFTLGKQKYAEHEGELKQILEKSEKLRLEFLTMVDRDVIAFQSKDPRQAMDIPLMICRLCREAIKLCPPLLTKGNVNLISDVGVAAVMLEASYVSSSFNVNINLKTMNDPALAAKIREELAQAIIEIKQIRQDTEVHVGKVIGG